MKRSSLTNDYEKAFVTKKFSDRTERSIRSVQALAILPLISTPVMFCTIAGSEFIMSNTSPVTCRQFIIGIIVYIDQLIQD